MNQVREVKHDTTDPDTGAVTIKTTSTWQAGALTLWTHPHESSCPLVAVDSQDVPPDLDLYRVLDPSCTVAPTQLQSEHDLVTWWRSLPTSKTTIARSAIRRLVTKATLPVSVAMPCQDPAENAGDDVTQPLMVHVPPAVQQAVVKEGLQGLWELCADRTWARRLPIEAVQAVVTALTGDALEATVSRGP
jgi:hypothetical protein